MTKGRSKKRSRQVNHDNSKIIALNDMELKDDHENRPLWVLPNGLIYLEATSKVYPIAYDFLVAVAEPKSRPKYIHQYKLTIYSLLAAVSLNLAPNTIVQVLEKLSKNLLAKEVKDFIFNTTRNFGKAKLVLKKNALVIEAKDKVTLNVLKAIDEVKFASLAYNNQMTDQNEATEAIETINIQDEDEDISFLLERNNLDIAETIQPVHEKKEKVFNLPIDKSSIEKVKRATLSHDFPLLEEYDFKRDNISFNLSIELKEKVEIRNYQAKSLQKMFGNGRARSGLIVLPCGAGKTLTGIAACSTLKKSCIVLCTSTVAVHQWKEQFLEFSTVKEQNILLLTSKQKDEVPITPCILITTYNMIAYSSKRSEEGEYLMKQIAHKNWGLLICDEVHVVPAKLFRSVCTKVTAHCKLGLSATLLREDNLISDLNFLIGPKLYEANWMDLTKEGYLANVSCNEVICSITKEFFREYLNLKKIKNSLRSLLCILNPTKVLACEYLINYHESKGDRILVFCDNIFALEELKTRLKRQVIHGKTPQKERFKILSSFKHNLSRTSGTIFISKVGDIAINLPSANVLIQMSSHFGSRRQEAQRLGRILRPKSKVITSLSEDSETNEFNAYFYSLITSDTEEVYYSGKRRDYLLQNGYSFRTLTLDEMMLGADEGNSFYSSTYNNLSKYNEQMNLLARILLQAKTDILNLKKQKKLANKVADDDLESLVSDEEDFQKQTNSNNKAQMNTKTKNLKLLKEIQIVGADSEESSSDEDEVEVEVTQLTGAANLDYIEYDS